MWKARGSDGALRKTWVYKPPNGVENSFFGPLAISAVPGAYRLAVHVYPPARELPADDVIEQLPSVKVNVAPEVIRSTGPLSGGEEPPPPGARTGAFGGTRERKVR